jgi:lipopolysaccharide export system permease protein
MNVLDRYIIREILKGTFVALLMLYTLFNLFTLKHELKSMGVGSYDLPQILMYLGLMIPHYVYELMPSAALLGSLFVLGNMANHRELVAMRASGISLMGIIRSVLMAGAILTTFSFIIGEFIGPESERKAKILKSVAKTNYPIARTKNGMWLRDGEQFINVKDSYLQGHIGNIYIYTLDNDRNLKEVIYAKHGQLISKGKWLLKEVDVSSLSRAGVTVQKIATKQWSSSIDNEVLDIVVMDPENLALVELSKYINFLKDNKQDFAKYELAFWARAINPFITLVMLLVAAPFVVGVGRGVAMGPRMVMGILIGMSFNIIDNSVGQMGVVYGFNPLFVATLPSLLVLLAALYAISRLR